MRILIVSFFVVVLDQITKLLVKGFSLPFLGINYEGMRYGQSIDIFGSFFKLTFVENPGMAFGIDLGGSSKIFLSLFSIIAGIGIIYYLYKSSHQKKLFRIALALILGGAIGNLIDRSLYGVFYGYAPIFEGKVVDFLNVDFFDFTLFGQTYERWPIFNIADAAVSVGVVILVLFHKSFEEHESQNVNDTEKKDETLLIDENKVSNDSVNTILDEDGNEQDNKRTQTEN